MRELKRLQKQAMRKVEDAKQICKTNCETAEIHISEIAKSQEDFDKWFYEHAFTDDPNSPTLVL